METGMQIIGICLVRNEERFLNLVLANIIDFCDAIIIADNNSTDRTAEIAAEWANNYSSVVVQNIDHPVESHEMLLRYINTPTWVFAVDGDEVYDPEGLSKLRGQILSGNHDRYWRIIGNVLNCLGIDEEARMARGYLSPPSRSITKLFNFNAILEWSEVRGERLHGGQKSFKENYQDSSCLRMHEEISWDESCFRCLHLCFMPRSRKDGNRQKGIVTRWNLAEQQSRGGFVYALSKLLNFWGISMSSDWKYKKYGRGEVVSRDVSAFLSHRSSSISV